MNMYVKYTVDICIELALNKKLSILKPVSHNRKHCTFLVILKRNHCRRTVRVPTLNFAEVIVYELSMWLRNKKIKNSVFEWSRFKGTQLQTLYMYVSVNIKKNHCRRTVRVPTLNFAEVIVYDELSMWLKNKKSDFEWSRFKGVFVNFEPFIIVSLLSGLFAQKALSNTFNLIYIYHLSRCHRS